MSRGPKGTRRATGDGHEQGGIAELSGEQTGFSPILSKLGTGPFPSRRWQTELSLPAEQLEEEV